MILGAYVFVGLPDLMTPPPHQPTHDTALDLVVLHSNPPASTEHRPQPQRREANRHRQLQTATQPGVMPSPKPQPLPLSGFLQLCSLSPATPSHCHPSVSMCPVWDSPHCLTIPPRHPTPFQSSGDLPHPAEGLGGACGLLPTREPGDRVPVGRRLRQLQLRLAQKRRISARLFSSFFLCRPPWP